MRLGQALRAARSPRPRRGALVSDVTPPAEPAPSTTADADTLAPLDPPAPMHSEPPSRSPESRGGGSRAWLRSGLLNAVVGSLVGALVASGVFLALDDGSSSTVISNAVPVATR